MTSSRVMQAGLRGGRAPFQEWGVAYKVGLGVTAVGLGVMLVSPLFAGVVTALLDLLGAPEGRTLLPEASGGALLRLYGFFILTCGVCLFCGRLALELVGLVRERALTGGMRLWGKLAAGAGAVAVVAWTVSDLLDSLSSFVSPGWATGPTLTAGRLIALLILFAISAFVFSDAGRRARLLGWTDRVGWGTVRQGWINRYALALLAAGALCAILQIGGVTAMIIIGVAVLLSGLVPQYFWGRRP